MKKMSLALIMVLSILVLSSMVLAALPGTTVQQCNTVGVYAGQCRSVYYASTPSGATALAARLNALPPYVLHGTYYQVV